MTKIMEAPGKKDKITNRVAARNSLLVSVFAIMFAFIGELKIPKRGHSIWPMTSQYFLPSFLILIGYVCLAFFIVAVLFWIITGDE